MTAGQPIYFNYLQSAGLYIALSLLSSLYTAFIGPLSKVPGPFWAKVTSYYIPYHLLYRSTNFTTLFARLHARYGPVIRIAFDEVHVASIDDYNRICNKRFDKEPTLYKCFGEDKSSFGELTFVAMKVRKDRLTGLFTRSGVKGLEHVIRENVIRENVDRTLRRMLKECGGSKSTDFLLAMKCLAVDVVTTFCFTKNIDAIETPGFRAPIIMTMEASIYNFLVFMNFPIVNKIIFSLPRLSTPASNMEPLQLSRLAQRICSTRQPRRRPNHEKGHDGSAGIHKGLDHLATSTIFVKPEYRDKNIGAMLIREGIKQAAALGLSLFLCSVPSAVDFYQKLGFQDTRHADIDLAQWGPERPGFGIYRLQGMSRPSTSIADQ